MKAFAATLFALATLAAPSAFADPAYTDCKVIRYPGTCYEWAPPHECTKILFSAAIVGMQEGEEKTIKQIVVKSAWTKKPKEIESLRLELNDLVAQGICALSSGTAQ